MDPFGRICLYPLVSWVSGIHLEAGIPPSPWVLRAMLAASHWPLALQSLRVSSGPAVSATNPPVADSVLWSGVESSTRIKGVCSFLRGGGKGEGFEARHEVKVNHEFIKFIFETFSTSQGFCCSVVGHEVNLHFLVVLVDGESK